MTRINTIPPEDLLDQHLFAEYRELPRAVNGARPLSAREAERLAHYRLGSGHVLFFYPRGAWLVRRHAVIVQELQRRGYTLSERPALTPRPGLDADWEPDAQAHALNLGRLSERLKARPSFYRLRGAPVAHDYYDHIHLCGV